MQFQIYATWTTVALLILYIYQTASKHFALPCSNLNSTLKQRALEEFKSNPFDYDQDPPDHLIQTLHPDNPCPPIHEVHSNRRLRDRSTCPWQRKADDQEDMYPRRVANAVCLRNCDVCSLPRHCEPIIANEPRLWKTGSATEDGLCEWKGFYYPKAVGCTCAYPMRRRDWA